MVEVSRGLDEKNAEVTPASFEQVVSGLKQQLGSSSELNQTVQTTSEEISRKLGAIYKAKDVKAKDVTIDQPTPLGTLFQMRDPYAFAMVVPVSSGGATARTINASVLLRIRNRLVFVYLYSDANDENSLKWIERAAEAWAREILRANSK